MANSGAHDHCATGIDHFVRWQASAMGHMDAAIAADATAALPRLVKAWVLIGGRDAQFSRVVAELAAEARGCVSAENFRQMRLLAGLAFAQAGRGIEAATELEQILQRSPTDVLVHQLIQNELFWMGRAGWMRDVAERAAPAWTESTDSYGPFMSLRAFANEEAGFIDDAERYGRIAVEIDPNDVWGAHAVAHVLIMKGEMHRGLEWLVGLSGNWGHANQLRHHLWWHVCLFLLELGEHDRIIDLLTSEIRNPASPLVQAAPAAAIDIQNFASLLMRLELYGVDVADHWQALATVCAGRVNNHGNAFCNIHDAMVLAATSQFDKLDELLGSMRARYADEQGSVALAYQAAGIPACEAMLAHRKGDYDTVVRLLGGARHDFALLGASHAQRDVLFHVLVHAARRSGRDDLHAVFLRDIERTGFCAVPDRAAYRV